MRTFITAFIALLLTAVGAQAQFEKGDWELGMTITAGSYRESWKDEDDEGDDRMTYLAFALTPGYFLINGLSIEPEFSFYTLQDADATFQLLGNLSYTGWLPDRRAAWFVRAGAGVGNGVPFPGTNFTLYDIEESVFILNFGAGVKVPIQRHVALKTELNYRIYQFTQDYHHYDYYGGYYSTTADWNVTDFSIRIGFSILL